MPVPFVFNLAVAPGCGLRSMIWMCCSPWTARNAGAGTEAGAVGVLGSLHAATTIAPAATSGRDRFIAAPPSNNSAGTPQANARAAYSTRGDTWRKRRSQVSERAELVTIGDAAKRRRWCSLRRAEGDVTQP